VSFTPLPITITRDSPAAGSDTVTVMHSNSAFGNVPTTLTGPIATSDDAINAANGDGFVLGDLILISEGTKACSLLQASAAATKVGTNWTLAHAPGAVPFNPPLGTNVFPAGGYATGAVVTNLGAMTRREYFVQGSNLMMRDRNVANSGVAPLNPLPLVDGVVAIRAQYGRDTNADGYIDVFDNTAPASPAEVVAVRMAVVARSAQLEKTAVSPATLTLWNGGTVANGGAISLTATQQQYRYKVYQTTIPLRNVIWNNN
jgi:type IV pilus assembly protein PilW